jgi:tRNA threonylcarbamoyl adenosine modification protein YjeE
MTRQTTLFSSDSPEATTALARALAIDLAPGDVVLLAGGVGAGKTHFARSAIQSLLPAPEDVPSPTFTLVQSYDTRLGEVWHADLYRVGDPSELEELGLLAAFDEAICLVEWPDRLGDAAPQSALLLTFEQGEGDDGRRITAEWSDPVWTARIEALKNV